MTDNSALIRVIENYRISQWIKVLPREDYIHIVAGEILQAWRVVIPPGNPKPGTVFEVRGVWLSPEQVEVLSE